MIEERRLHRKKKEFALFSLVQKFHIFVGSPCSTTDKKGKPWIEYHGSSPFYKQTVVALRYYFLFCQSVRFQ